MSRRAASVAGSWPRRLKTSVPQLYRLLDTTNTRKSMNQLVSLLQILDCSIELVVTDKEAVA